MDNTFEIINADLLKADADAICQQVNCQSVMGSGLAKAIYTKWPVVKERSHAFCDAYKDPLRMLGRVQIITAQSLPFEVVNIFGQLHYGRTPNTCYTDYFALKQAFIELNGIYAGKTIAFPYKFGCGLAGGDWQTVENLMFQYLTDCNVQIYRL